jgi:hypothetical protein
VDRVTTGAGSPAGARALLTGTVDYSGTFPPASLDVATAVANYASYRSGPFAWMLGRFVIIASQLDEFAQLARPVLPKGPTSEPWRLSVVTGHNLHGAVRDVERFNQAHGRNSAAGHAVVETMEHKVVRPQDVRDAEADVPVPVRSVFEIRRGPNMEVLLRAVRDVEGIAEFRAGGPTPDEVPDVATFARFIVSCAQLAVPMKATAGLQHAIRAVRPFGDGPDAPTGPQHGFVNVLMATALARTRLKGGATEKDVLMLTESVLDERNPAGFTFDANGAGFWTVRIGRDDLAHAREEFFLKFGSCSFEQPAADLRALGLAD